jgi:hypothetical protein
MRDYAVIKQTQFKQELFLAEAERYSLLKEALENSENKSFRQQFGEVLISLGNRLAQERQPQEV